MSIIEKIKADKIAAMKSGDKARKDTLTLVQAAVKQVEVDTRKDLSDEDVIQILKKMVKQRNDSINQYTTAGRLELAAIEESERTIIYEYIPTQMSEQDIRIRVYDLVSPEDTIGSAMAFIKPVFAGKADMGIVSRIVKEVIGGA